MQRHLLTCALLAALSPAVLAAGTADPAATYIVRFAEAPLASFRGDARDPQLAALKATSPAVTGTTQLDVDAPASQAYRRELGQRREQRLLQAEQRLGRALEPAFVYDVVFNGVALELTSAEAKLLAQVPGVAAVERETLSRPLTDAGPQWIGATEIWSGATNGGTAYRGEGVVVGVIDTGINRTHPSFAARGAIDGFQHANPRGAYIGLCTTNASLCNDKLIGIHDFTICTGTHASSSCNDREANDGSDVDGHGSHVASTAVGNVATGTLTVAGAAISRQISGVAPHANVIMYKACEEEETCRGSWLLASINQAAIDRVQVLNYSIGGGPSNPWQDGDAQAMLALREAGTVVVVAAGNDGPGVSTLGSPADAPWVLAVANVSHDRVVQNRLVDLTGGATAPPSGGILVGTGSTGPFGPAPIVVPTDHPRCSTGDDLDSPPSGVSNPWSPGRFSGEIVVCERGVQARVAKSNNVRLAGGGGMVLVNTAAEGNGTAADAHSIPGTHIGYDAGVALKQWLASGTGHRGRIEGAQIRNDPAFGDVLSGDSGRGPIANGNYLKPSVAAPGTAVLAAAGTGNGGALLSGTSMASPHVAGAAALLRGVKPTWTVSEVESALISTAHSVVRLADGTPASVFDQGAGRIDVAAAVRAGLGFEVTPAEFRAANPAQGGQANALNQPSIVTDRCFERCTFTRRVKDLVGGGRWRAVTTAATGMTITVTPAEFELAAGASQSLQIVVDVSNPQLVGSVVDGSVVLQRTDATGTPVTRLPVNVYSDPGEVPEAITAVVDGERGYTDVSVSNVVAISDLQTSTTALATPVVGSQVTAEDATASDAYDSFESAFVRLVTIPATPGAVREFRLRAQADADTANDIDLFVGLDENGDGLPAEDEERCRSATGEPHEDCTVSVDSASTAQRVWVYAQNFDASTSGVDSIRLETTLVDMQPVNAAGLVATGPGKTARLETFTLRVQHDDTTLAPGETRRGYLFLRAAGAAQSFAEVPVTITRGAASLASSPKVLVSGRTERVKLAAGVSADRYFIDVPPNASELLVRIAGRTGDEVDVITAYSADPAGPAIAPAGDTVLAAGTGGANETLRITAPTLRAGRWYVKPQNAGSTAAEFDMTATLTYAGNRAQPKYGAYFNPARSGAGAFLFPAGDVWGFAWYTYLQDGTPTWYLGVGPKPGAQEGAWKVDLLRYRWNGTAAVGTDVGEAVVTLVDPQTMRFNWNLDGQSGSERYQWVDGGACPQRNGAAFDASGLWFSPDRPGFGYSINAYATVETNGAYFYDAQGIARWAFASTQPLATSDLSLELRRGFCPLCDYAAPTTSPVGTLRRTYDSAGAGRIVTDITLPAPLSGRWQVDLPVSKLSEPLGCN